MVSDSRTNNSIRNSFFGILLRFENIFGAFFARTVLIRILGVEYAGLDGLFTSILNFLNMAESGFSTAIVYKLYKPVSENDTTKVCSLLNFYKKIYRFIGLAILLLGIVLTPFVDRIIKGDVPDEINIKVLFIIYLINTSFSYFIFAYKSALLNACQRNDRISKVTGIVLGAKYIIQIFCVLVFKSYYLFIIVLPLSTMATNLGIEYISRRYYSQYTCKGAISKEDKNEIMHKVYALLFNKIGTSIINGSGSIVISYFLGIYILGIYNSYFYILHMIYGVFSVFHNAITASVGNSIIWESVEKNMITFKRLFFLNSWAVGVCSICLLCSYTPFIRLWIGNDKTFDEYFALLMSLYFYLWMIRFIVIIFKSAQGLWWEDRYRSFIEGIVNIVLSICLVKHIGVYAVLISSITAMVIVSIPWETYVLFSKYFKKGLIEFYSQLFASIFTSFICGMITFYLSRLWNIDGLLRLIYCSVISILIPNIVFLLFYFHNENFKWMRTFLANIIHQKFYNL
jgi:O-antigen/teichoic acid export membrane protein